MRFGAQEMSPEKIEPHVWACKRENNIVLENELLRVEMSGRGDLHQVYDKETGREVLDGAGNQLWGLRG